MTIKTHIKLALLIIATNVAIAISHVTPVLIAGMDSSGAGGF